MSTDKTHEQSSSVVPNVKQELERFREKGVTGPEVDQLISATHIVA